MIDDGWRPREVWLVIEEAPKYLISSLGRVQNIKSGRILKPGMTRMGYLKVVLPCIDCRWYNLYIHRLVCCAFFGRYDDLEVNHLDGVKTNNFVGNLEWTTRLENMRHARRIGLHSTYFGRIRIIETGQICESQAECARAIGGQKTGVRRVLNGVQPKHKGYSFEYVE